MSHLCHHCWLSLVFSLCVMCQRVLGLVRRTKPGHLSGDHKVCAVGGWWLHLHSQHQAGETRGCSRENHPGSGEEQKNKQFPVDVAVWCFCLVHLLCMYCPGGWCGARGHRLYCHLQTDHLHWARRGGWWLFTHEERISSHHPRLPQLCCDWRGH